MKVALIGSGKTGKEVIKQLPAEALTGVYNTSHRATSQTLSEADVVVVFVPGTAISELIETLIACRRPVVCGSTGVSWPSGLQERLTREGICWVRANNFSLGMTLVRKALQLLRGAQDLLPHPSFHLHEIHHAHKKDAPSGTALSWKQWLDLPVDITWERKGEVKGDHSLTIHTDQEEILLAHHVLDRAVFAQGALWTAQQLSTKTFWKPGLWEFHEVTEKLLRRENHENQAR